MTSRLRVIMMVLGLASMWSSPGNAAGPYFFDDYLPFSNKWSAHRLSPSGQFVGQWATWSNNSVDMTIFWNNAKQGSYFDWSALQSVEKFQIRPNCSNGADWVFLNGYRDNSNPNVIYWIKTEKALLKIAGGITYDISGIANAAGGCAVFNAQVGGGTYIGMPYAPYVFWDQSYELQVWGKVADAQGALTRDFYWKVAYDPGQQANNPCWTGAGATRTTILQREAYWTDFPNNDSATSPGWQCHLPESNKPCGSGVVDMANLTASNIKLARYNRYAFSAGPGWQLGDVDLVSGSLLPPSSCVPNVWSY